MKRVLIMHGTAGNSQENWFPWLKVELEKKGYIVWVPNLPGSEHPSIHTYNKFILGHKQFNFNADTIIVGHSSGAVATLGLLQELPENTKINKVYLVGAFNGDLGWSELKNFYEKPFDFELIKTKANQFIFIHSDNDPYCPLEHAQFLAQQTDGELIVIPGQKHFSVSTMGEKYTEFPELLSKIKDDLNN